MILTLPISKVLDMDNTYTLKISETASRYTVTIIFSEPFRVGDNMAWSAAKERILHFMRMNHVRISRYNRAKRIDEKSFTMVLYK